MPETMKPKRSMKNGRGDTSIRPRDWMLIAGGIVVVAALVAFALTRTRRKETSVPVAAAPPAPATVSAAQDHDHAAEAGVRRITAAELRTAIEGGNAVVIDVRDVDGYAAGHIHGSMHIPLSFIESQAQYLPRGKTIVAYCT